MAEPLHAQLRGMGIAAGLALGVVQPAEVRDLVTVDGTFTPDPANRAVYDALYGEFKKLYKAQKGMFSRLNSSKKRKAAS
jgi:xylulokinase